MAIHFSILPVRGKADRPTLLRERPNVTSISIWSSSVMGVAVMMVSLLLPLESGVAQGGMGGGMGGRGGMGGPGMGGRGGAMRSPATVIKENLERNDPLAFLLDRKKPLQLTKVQQDTFKSYRKEMQRMQEPLFKSLDKLFADAPGAERGGGMGRGGMGGMGGGRGAPPTRRSPVAKDPEPARPIRCVHSRRALPTSRTHIVIAPGPSWTASSADEPTRFTPTTS